MEAVEQEARLAYPEPQFEAFTLKVSAGREKTKARAVVKTVLGKGWTIRPYGGKAGGFEVFSPGPPPAPGTAWELTYLLRQQPEVMLAEPLFKVCITDRADWLVAPAPGAGELVAAAAIGGLLSFFCGQGPDALAARDSRWSLQRSGVIAAWNSFAGATPGAGIVIGHPDTGYRLHPEIAASLDTADGFDFVREDNDALDELRSGFLLNPGHGTGTASVIVSPPGAPAGGQPPGVSGVAPGATLIPFRVGESVIIFDPLNLSRAIERATDAGAHIISISMGGLFGQRLYDAVRYAQSKGVIVLAAAGNCVRFVAWPAAYDEVIAVAASDAQDGIWSGSSRGGAVDITAPGDRVWHAEVRQQNGVETFTVEQGSGTSYAVATVAGIAALWLAHWGRAALIARFGAAKLPAVFNQLLRKTATPMPGWSSGEFGGGLVNAAALLNEPLPDGVLEPLFAAAPQDTAAPGGLPTFAHLFEPQLRTGATLAAAPLALAGAQLQENLAALLGVSLDKLPGDLRQVGQELAFYFATDPALYNEFAAVLTRPRAPEAAGAAVALAAPLAGPRGRMLIKDVSTALRTRLASG